jgi:Flp pilus assembly protein TadG
MAKLTGALTSLMAAKDASKRLALRSRNQIRSESGSAVVEMAFSSTILFAMFFGLFQMTMASYVYQYVSDAAREGSRWAIVRGSSCSTNTPNLDHCGAASTDIQTYVRSLKYPVIVPANLTVAATWYSPSSSLPTTWTLCSSGTCDSSGNLVKVVVTYNYPFSVPFVPARTISVSSTSQMVVSQ